MRRVERTGPENTVYLPGSWQWLASHALQRTVRSDHGPVAINGASELEVDSKSQDA